MASEGGRDWAAARAAGVVFYELPDELDYANVDPLIAPACRRINASGWVATGESCQGHPDDVTPLGPWARNTDPYLRLVCRADDLGRMLGLLLRACEPHIGGAEMSPAVSLRLGMHGAPAGWAEVYAYLEAKYAGERDSGIRALERFAEALHADSPLGAPPADGDAGGDPAAWPLARFARWLREGAQADGVLARVPRTARILADRLDRAEAEAAEAVSAAVDVGNDLRALAAAAEREEAERVRAAAERVCLTAVPVTERRGDEDVVVGYQHRTGALHALVGALGLALPRIAAASPVSDISVCHLPYQDRPFVHGVRDGNDVWLRRDGTWSEEDGDPECALRVGGWDPPSGQADERAANALLEHFAKSHPRPDDGICDRCVALVAAARRRE